MSALDATVVPGLTPARLRSLVVTLAAAEASGVARWCLDTAVEYAGLREQFGQKIGAFQAIKHLCAEMLETSESVTAAAWDAARAATDDDPAQQEFAALVAGTICFDGAVAVAKACIQVLGGIGFTFEHDAHLYLRRALALRSPSARPDSTPQGWPTSPDRHPARGPGRPRGCRRELPHRGPGAGTADRRAARGGAPRRPGGERVPTPHWPEPHGLGPTRCSSWSSTRSSPAPRSPGPT